MPPVNRLSSNSTGVPSSACSPPSGTRPSRFPAPIRISTAVTCSMPSPRAIFPSGNSRVQLFTQEQADSFPFDHLDATKLIPEELVPLKVDRPHGAGRWPNNFFAETNRWRTALRMSCGHRFLERSTAAGPVVLYSTPSSRAWVRPISTRSRSMRPSARSPIINATAICRWRNRPAGRL